MAKLTQLTAAQRARMPAIRDEWIKSGLSCESMDLGAATPAIAELYRAAGLEVPPIIAVSSPIVAALAAPIAGNFIAALRELEKQQADIVCRPTGGDSLSVVSSMGRAVRNAVSNAVRNAVSRAVGSAVNSAVGNAVFNAVSSAVDSVVRSAVSNAVGSAVNSAVGNAVDSAVGGSVRNAVVSDVGSAVFSAVDNAVGSAVDSVVGSAVDSAVRNAVVNAVYSAVRNAVVSDVGSAVFSAVDNAVGSAVGSAVDSAVRNAVVNAVYSAVRNAVVSDVGSAVGGSVGSSVRNAVVSDVGSAVDSVVRNAVDSDVRNAVSRAVGSAVNSAVGNAVFNAVGNAVFNAVSNAVDNAVSSAVDSVVRSAVSNAVGSAVNSAVGNAVDSAVGGSVGSSVRNAVVSAVGSAVDSVVRNAVSNAVDNAAATFAPLLTRTNGALVAAAKAKVWYHYFFWGAWSAGWASYLAALQEFGADLGDAAKLAESWQTIARNIGPWWPNKDFVMVSDRPLRTQHDEQGRLHCDDGPAVLWRDGWAIYSIHGVTVPRKAVEAPETITVAEIKGEQNAEIKRILREKYGTGRYLADTGAEVVHVDTIAVDKLAPRGIHISRALLREADGTQYLVGSDGSTHRVYFMRVDPKAKTCREAHESISGLSEDKLIMQS